MIHVGYPKMCKMCSSSKIREELDKTKELLPKVEIKAEVIDMAAVMKGASSAKSAPKKSAPKEEKSAPKEDSGDDAPPPEPTKEKFRKNKIKSKIPRFFYSKRKNNIIL